MAGTSADKLDYLKATKSAIRRAIQAKGQTVADTDPFRSYADKIAAIGGTSKFTVTKQTVTVRAGEIPLYYDVDIQFISDTFLLAVAVIESGGPNPYLLCLMGEGGGMGENSANRRGQCVSSSAGTDTLTWNGVVRKDGTDQRADYFWTVASGIDLDGKTGRLYLVEVG